MELKKRVGFYLTLALSLMLFIAARASAQTGIRFEIESVNSDLFPQVKAYLSISNPQGFPLQGLPEEAFSVFEDGAPIADFDLTYGVNTQQALSFVLVVDTSDSMNRGGTPSNMDDSIAAAMEFLGKLTDQDQVALVTFGSTVVVAQEMTSEKDLVLAALDEIAAEGPTYLYDGLMQGIDLLSDVSTRRVIILLADGNDSNSDNNYDTVIAEAIRNNIPIFPIGFFAVDEEEFASMATITGGTDFVGTDTTGLSAAFNSILQILREQYIITYISGIAADNAEHSLSIKLDYLDETFEDSTAFLAVPAELSVSLPDYDDGDVIGGKVTFDLNVLGPAPVEKVEIYIDDELVDTDPSGATRYILDTAGMFEGLYDFWFVVTDTAGNVGEITISLEIEPAVIVEIISPSAGDALSKTTPIEAEVTGQSRIAKVEFLVDGEVLDEMDRCPCLVPLPVQDYDLGAHILAVRATDALGNTGQDEIEVTIRPPINVTFNSPEAGAQLRGEVTVSVEIDAQLGVESVQFFADGAEIGTATAAPYQITWELYGVDPGEYVITVLVTDLEGRSVEEKLPVTVITGGGGGGGGGGSAWLYIGIALVVIAGVVIPMALRRRKREATPGAGGVPVLIEQAGVAPGTRWPLDKPEVSLGRKSSVNDIALSGLKASRQMAVIQMREGQYMLFSLNPDNPPFVNEVPVAREYALQPGDVIRMGDSIFVFER